MKLCVNIQALNNPFKQLRITENHFERSVILHGYNTKRIRINGII